MKIKSTEINTISCLGEEGVKALILDIQYENNLINKLFEATFYLGQLESLFLSHNFKSIYPLLMKKETLFSFKLDNCNITLDDLLGYEMCDESKYDADLIMAANYIRVLNLGLSKLESGEELSVDLIRSMHSELFISKGVGKSKIENNLKDIVNFIQFKSSQVPPLIVAGLAYAYFDSTCLFEDGNGRFGRMIVTLVLVESGMKGASLLSLSHFLLKHKEIYTEKLLDARLSGHWEGWLEFFLEGISKASVDVISAIQELDNIYKRDKEELFSSGKKTSGILLTFEVLFSQGVANAQRVASDTKLRMPTVNKVLRELEDLGMVVETTGKQRGRSYMYSDVYRVLTSDLD